MNKCKLHYFRSVGKFFVFFEHEIVKRSRNVALAYNTQISVPKNKSMKATSLGIWYVQIPSGIVVNPIGVIVEPKTHKGSRYVVVNRKIKAVSKLPHLNYLDAMNFKEIFCQ